MDEREYKQQEYKIELKMVAILSVDHIDEIKEKIPALIKRGIESYDYEYCMEQADDNDLAVGNRNAQRLIALQVSEFNKITQKEKDFVNNIIVPSRHDVSFPTSVADVEEERNRVDKYAKIWMKQEKELEDSFIDTQICEKIKFAKRRSEHEF